MAFPRDPEDTQRAAVSRPTGGAERERFLTEQWKDESEIEGFLRESVQRHRMNDGWICHEEIQDYGSRHTL
jgi:hypothetical protein